MSVTREQGLVSVIVITFNQESFIRDAVLSAVEQDFKAVEVIVADDGSSDGTQEIIREMVGLYPDKVIAAIGDSNEGIAANANRGLKLARGEYIAWLGGDDLMLPGKLSKQVSLLKARPDAVGCVHDAEVFQSETGEMLGLFSEWANGREGLKEGGIELFFDHNYKMLPSTMMFRAEAAPSHGLDERLRYTNDWLHDVEVFRNGTVAVLNEVLGRYRRHGGNVTGSKGLNAIAVEDNLIAVGIIEARYPDLAKLARKKRLIVLLGASRRSWPKNRRLAALYLKAAIISCGLISTILFSFLWGFRRIVGSVQ